MDLELTSPSNPRVKELVGRIGGDRELLALGALAEAVAPEIGGPAIHS